MSTIKVGVREFRERIASFLESDTPVAVTRRGETLGEASWSPATRPWAHYLSPGARGLAHGPRTYPITTSNPPCRYEARQEGQGGRRQIRFSEENRPG